jgi:hypothetical protein
MRLMLSIRDENIVFFRWSPFPAELHPTTFQIDEAGTIVFQPIIVPSLRCEPAVFLAKLEPLATVIDSANQRAFKNWKLFQWLVIDKAKRVAVYRIRDDVFIDDRCHPL